MSQPQKGQSTIPAKERKTEKGVIKAVPSGNSVVIVTQEKQGPPTEKEVLLASVTVPRLGREGKADEPFAWAAREFLRKRAIGKPVSYTIIGLVSDKSKLYSGQVLLNGTLDLSKLMVEEGWADVHREEQRELTRLRELAQSEGRGMWTKVDEAVQSAIRSIPQEELDPVKDFDKYKGVPLQAVIEYVRTGSSLRAILLPSFQTVALSLSGALSPGFKRVQASTTTTPSSAASAVAGSSQVTWEPKPFAREALFFTEHHALHRDATITFEARDKQAVYATVIILGHNLSEELLKAGLAIFVEWNTPKPLVTKFRTIESTSKAAKLRIWAHGTPDIAPPERPKEEAKQSLPNDFVGRVIATSNTGAVTVVDPLNNERRLLLSSLKIPNKVLVGKSEEKEKKTRPDFGGKKKDEDDDYIITYEPFAFEAKEFLRCKLAGKKVRVVIDYVIPESEDKQQPERAYCTIFLDSNKNLAELMVEEGLATVFEHTSGSNRSPHYDILLAAERKAQQAGKALHGPKERAPVHHINDVSRFQSAEKDTRQKAQAKSMRFLPFLQKEQTKLRGVVEHVFSATRLKVYLPKHMLIIPFSLSGLQRVSEDENATLAEKSFFWTRNKCNGREVDLEIETVDRGGNFVGHLWVNKKKNLSAALLEQGFAKLAFSRGSHAGEYAAAETKAKQARKHIWENYDEQEELAKQKQEEEEKLAMQTQQQQQQKKNQSVEVVVTEIIDLTTFYVQVVAEALELENLMRDINSQDIDSTVTVVPIKAGSSVLAKFTADDVWYRAKVVKASGDQMLVQYTDYGNSETIPRDRVRPMLDQFRTLPDQAREVALAYLNAPPPGDDFYEDALTFFKELALGKQLLMNLEYMQSKGFVTLADPKAKVHVNAALLRAGLTTLQKRPPRQSNSQVLDTLKEEQEKARNAHLNLWQYGDIDEDEEEKPAAGPSSAPKKFGAKK
jgi:staphylococcal nuclease domain-containing protein 1